MTSSKTSNTSLVHLLHDHIYTHPSDKSLICLNAGEKFHLVEKISDNWWSVVRSEQDHQLLYVPVCYVDEISRGKHPDAVRRDPPPKPPVKPKDLHGKRDLPPEANKTFPALTDAARIELFNILISEKDPKSKAGHRSGDEGDLGKGSRVGEDGELVGDKDISDDNIGSLMRHGCKGSMQSLDLEFLDDYEGADSSLHDKSPEEPTARHPGLPPFPPEGAVPLKTYEGGYESHCDAESGRIYFFNRLTQDRSWILPRKVSQSAKDLAASEGGSKNGLGIVPSIWKDDVNDSGETVFVNQINGEKWIRLFDEHSREYFFNDRTQESRWDLPEFESTGDHSFEGDSDRDVYEFSDKAGMLYKAKLSENGKKIKKSWSHSYVVLCGSMLYFHKEQKKVNMSKNEGFLDLRSTTIQMGNNTRSSRKHLIQLTAANGTEYLLNHEEASVIEEWYEALSKNISLLTRLMSTLTTDKIGSSQSLNSEVDRSPTTNTMESTSPAVQKKNKEKQKQPKKEATMTPQDAVQSTAEKVRLKEKLRFWLSRRPTRDSLRANGIYKDGIFGSHLLTICEAEGATIPKFVQDCINAVEARGLTTDGVYRMNGNMADIQKLRFAVNQNDDYDLMDPDLDIHVVTGALKLFFRELMEPLFPFRFCNKFLDVLKLTDHSAKSKVIHELVLLIPTANYDTLKELFRHLVLVIQHSRENRMQAQNIAIVFGPTLIWPEETEMSELAVSVVQRGQLIEHMLSDYTFIFS